MTTRQEIRALIKRANARIEWVRNSKHNLFERQSENAVNAALHYAGKLTNANSDKFRIGGLLAEDEETMRDMLQRFLDNPLTTARGQREEVIEKGFETFNQNRKFNVTRETYENLVDIWESDTFQRLKENFEVYSGIINEMAKNPKSYRKAIAMIAGVNRSDKTNGKYWYNGHLDVDAFIERWREL